MITITPSPRLPVYVEEFAEDGGSPDESFDEMLTANATYLVPWASRWDVMALMMPAVYPGGGMDLTLRTPFQYPYLPKTSALYCQSCSCAPWVGNPASGSPGPVGPGPVLSWQYGKIKAHFSSLQNNDPMSLVWQESFSPAVEFVTLSALDGQGGNALFWASGHASADAIGSGATTLGLRYTKIEWTVTRRWAPIDFPDEILDYVGTINSTEVASGIYPALDFAQDQLLYDSFTPEQDRFADGSPAVKLTMRFIGLVGTGASWNKFAHPDPTSTGNLLWTVIYNKNDNAFNPFKENDLNDLLGW